MISVGGQSTWVEKTCLHLRPGFFMNSVSKRRQAIFQCRSKALSWCYRVQFILIIPSVPARPDEKPRCTKKKTKQRPCDWPQCSTWVVASSPVAYLVHSLNLFHYFKKLNDDFYETPFPHKRESKATSGLWWQCLMLGISAIRLFWQAPARSERQVTMIQTRAANASVQVKK